MGPGYGRACSSCRRAISARTRAMNSVGFSPSARAHRRAEDDGDRQRPAFGHFEPRGCASCGADDRDRDAPGRRLAIASAAAPGLKCPMLPSFERVPSGKTSSGTSCCSSIFALTLRGFVAAAVDRERVEEQRGQPAAPPDVEEVVGRRRRRRGSGRAGAGSAPMMSGASRWLEWLATTTNGRLHALQLLACR